MTFPEAPGLWRRIDLHPRAGHVSAGLEDDFHRFTLRLEHADGIVTGVEARAERYPWTTCPGATTFLAEQAVGLHLQALAAMDPYIHCTHLFELAVLCAAHALDSRPTRFDLWVADRVDDRTSVALLENGSEVLRWQLHGTLIAGPGEWVGRELRKMSVWRQSLDPVSAERAMLMRRAVHISGGRAHVRAATGRAADAGPARLGACYTYTMPRARDAEPVLEWRIDFSRTGQPPLQGYNPDARGGPDR
jgi:hypothetical protein